MCNRRRLFSLALAFIVPLLILWGLLMTLNSQAVTAASTDPGLPQPNLLGEAIRQGKYPAQLVGHSGDIRPDRHGPQRNDPADGIPAHAYSPFDERRNRDYPCPPGGCEFQEGRVLVKLAPQVCLRGLELQGAWTEDGTLNETLQAQGVLRLEPVFPQARSPKPGEFVVSPEGERLPKPDLTRWYRAVLTDEKADVYAVVQALSEAPGIAWAELDYLRRLVGNPPSTLLMSGEGKGDKGDEVRAFSAPTDPLYPQQWHLSAARIPDAWAYLESQGLPAGGNRDIVVAVIDTGVDLNHPDLAANLWTNSREVPGNGVDDDGNGFVDDVHGADVIVNSGNPMDDHGHGTHVAGIVAAQANNSIGGVGVAYNVQLMAIKAAQYSGVLASSDIAEAIYYAVAQGADVINMSFGGYARSQVEEDALAVAFGQAVLVAAAGNDGKVNLPCPGGRDMYPAAYNWVLGVMASTPGGGRASFSNSDCTPHDSHEYELMAPGVDVWSTLPLEQYAAWDGTSMATPTVSGIAALARTKWSDKDVYSSRFIMGQIAANANPVADAYAALTVAPQPELSYLEQWLFDTADQSPDNDDDGIMDAGETIDLAIVIRNHWGKADPVTVTLEAWAEGDYQPDPYVTMITDTVDYGAIGSFNQDDNGLIYDEQGVIIGVRHPFRFNVDPNTPNDHVILFRLTMTARNGLDLMDTTVYTFQSHFYLIVQRGRELPRIISQDMTLNRDYYWIVPDQTLIEAGVMVTVTEGTQIQFWTSNPSSPYSQNANAFWQVEGGLVVQGTSDQPVEIFPDAVRQCKYGWDFLADCLVKLKQEGAGCIEVYYGRILNLNSGARVLDHTYLSMSGNLISAGSVNPGAILISHSILHRLSGASNRYYLWGGSGAPGSRVTLYDSTAFDIVGSAEMVDNVFLINYKPLYWSSDYGSRIKDVSYGFRNNAILNTWWNLDVTRWLRFEATTNRGTTHDITGNYWGNASSTLIDAAIKDFNDDFNRGLFIYQPMLTNPPTTAYPFVVDMVLSTASSPRTSIVGAETVTFTVTFNRNMDMTVQPQVSFGPDVPNTDYTVHAVNGGWQDPCTWVGTFNVTPVTGDGYQLIRVAGARAADDPWLVTGDDAGRFRFEIITSGTEAMNLQATGGEGYVDLMWIQNDFDLLAGFNLYRSTSISGTYTLVNTTLLLPDQRTYRDTDVQPGQPYYYKFTVVKTDMTESDFSNVATATPLVDFPDYDFNRDCKVDVVDIMQVASRWRCRSVDSCYDDDYDIDKDGDIDIVDIMLVVKHWGETCE